MADVGSLFVIGCSRSGTTIVQKELAAYLDYFTLPETGFFLTDLHSVRARAGALNRLRRALGPPEGPPRRGAAGSLADLMATIWTMGPRRVVPGLARPRNTARLFAQVLDKRARREGARGWIEKTPLHFFRIKLIRVLLDRPRFVFVFRDGRDVVASIVDRSRRHPEQFPEQDLDYAVALWNQAVEVGREQIGARDLCFVDHRSLVASPEGTLAAVAEFFGIEARPQIPGLETAPEAGIGRIAHHGELWLQTAHGPVRPPENKWDSVLSPTERDRAVQALRLDDWAKLRVAPNYL